MMSSTLGAPLGGTTCGGQYGLESLALRLMTPPNFGDGFGRYLPSIVVVALGEPGSPVACTPLPGAAVLLSSAPSRAVSLPGAAPEPSSAPTATTRKPRRLVRSNIYSLLPTN